MKSELKIKALTPAEIASAVQGKLTVFGEASEVTSVCTSSNEASTGSLFVAIKGERADGLAYAPDAVNRGAVCIIAEREPENIPNGAPYALIVVPSAVKALGDLAGYYRTLSGVKCIGVTGSVGKTTTKEFISAVLSVKYKTHKSEGNHNNEIGMPMTLLSLEADDEIAVLEMGMSAFGEISYMSRLAKPELAVITNIGTAHLASLGSRENIAKAKTEMTDGMEVGAKLFMNTDEPLLVASLGKKPEVEKIKFGVNEPLADYRAVNVKTLDNGMEYDLVCPNGIVKDVYIPVIGQHNVYNSLVAFGMGRELGMTDGEIKLGLASFENTGMRQRIYKHGSVTVIEDCYNASPESMKASIDVLSSYAEKNGGTKTALLGDMLELGDNSASLHETVGTLAARAGIAKLFCYGEMAKHIAESAVRGGIASDKVFVSESGNPKKMAEIMKQNLADGDVLLVKASRGIKAEQVLTELGFDK